MKVINYIKEHGLELLNSVHGVIVKEYEDLVVLNYNQIESPVNDITNECRGLILEKGTWGVVSRAFDRFFNYGERQDQLNINLITASIFQKLDGSLIKIYNYKDVWYISTRGTAYAESGVNGWDLTFKDLVLKAINGGINDSQFQIYCNQHLDPKNTYICEVTSMENRVVTRYSGYNLTLLAIRNNETGGYQKITKLLEKQLSYALISRPKEFKFRSFEECVAAAKDLPDLEEGYVVYVDGVPTIKIKSPQYLICHRIKGEGLNPKRIMQLVLMNEQEEYLAYFPEDRKYFEPYREALNQIISEIESCYALYQNIELQKDFALAVKDNTFSAALFQARAKKLDPVHCFSIQREQYKMDVLSNFMKEQSYA